MTWIHADLACRYLIILRPVKGQCLFDVTFWEALLREEKSQNSVGKSVELKHFAVIKLYRSELVLLISSKHLTDLQNLLLPRGD